MPIVVLFTTAIPVSSTRVTLIARRQGIQESPDSGNTFPIYNFSRKYS
jgi:hypothetical protein